MVKCTSRRVRWYGCARRWMRPRFSRLASTVVIAWGVTKQCRESSAPGAPGRSCRTRRTQYAETVSPSDARARSLAGGPLTVDDLAAQVIDSAEAAGAGPIHLVGQSLGAVVAATVAARRPDLVAALVLVSGWNVTDPRGHAMFDLWPERWPSAQICSPGSWS